MTTLDYFFSFCLCFETVSHLAWNFPLVLSCLATEPCPVLRLCVHNNIQILSGGFSAQTPLLIPRRQVLDHLSYGPCSRSGFLHKPHGLSWVKKGRAQSLFPGMAISPMPTSHPWVKEDCDLLYHHHVMIRVMKWDGFSQMIISLPLAMGFRDICGSLCLGRDKYLEVYSYRVWECGAEIEGWFPRADWELLTASFPEDARFQTQ